MLKQIQESLCEDEEAKWGSIDPTEPNILSPGPSEFTRPPGLPGIFSEEIHPQPSEEGKKRIFHSSLEFGKTVDSVHSFPVNTDQLDKSDSEQSVVIEKRTLSPMKVEGFVPPFRNVRQESTMKFKAPRN